MVDLQNTIDGINDSNTKIFMEQLNMLRIKFKAETVIINLSSHIYTPDGLIEYLKVLYRNLIPGIVL